MSRRVPRERKTTGYDTLDSVFWRVAQYDTLEGGFRRVAQSPALWARFSQVLVETFVMRG